MDDPVKIKRETVKIEGGRNLYNYTFEVEGEGDEAEGKKQSEPKGNLNPKPEDKK